MSSILKVEDLAKQYRLGLVGTGTISHDLNRWWHRIRGKEDPYLKVGAVNDRSASYSEEYVWALKNINFEVKPGEVLGIIGRNGAGKSTLLKILSRVTSPTTGSIKTKGRIASLLEVGTGFHSELTGRENIFLNGAILGMTKKEIESKLDEIISFSGCEMYIDTPVKRYSSGMTVRLGFAVAAHLEPEILVVDEVLAVGDAEFQKKAIGKMHDLSTGEGRTVLFVSHNMASVKSLCTKALILKNGYMDYYGDVDKAVQKYLQGDERDSGVQKRNFSFTQQDFKILSLSVKARNKKVGEPLIRDEELLFTVHVNKTCDFDINLGLKFKDDRGQYLFVANTGLTEISIEKGEYYYQLEIPGLFFNEGNFFVDFIITDGRKVIHETSDALQFCIIHEPKKIGKWMGKSPGALKPDFHWTRLEMHG
ncbi:ABC transporter ATP-binding protein [Salinimicrobium catena]|uniref:ABC transporter ATP-binding protein n=1 Tax=Salinimicrobium catena TaxID=390640 RepID=UPI002FE45802